MNPLDNDDVKEIFSAISVAECEGFEFADLKCKLYELYPDVKKEHDERDKEDAEFQQKVTEMRKAIAVKFYQISNRMKNTSLLESMQEVFKSHYQEIRDNYSDEICLPADLYKYCFPELKQAGLIDEIRKYEHITKFAYPSPKDEDSWYTLSKIFSDLYCGIKKVETR